MRRTRSSFNGWSRTRPRGRCWHRVRRRSSPHCARSGCPSTEPRTPWSTRIGRRSSWWRRSPGSWIGRSLPDDASSTPRSHVIIPSVRPRRGSCTATAWAPRRSTRCWRRSADRRHSSPIARCAPRRQSFGGSTWRAAKD